MPNYFVVFSTGEKFQIGTIDGFSAEDAISAWGNPSLPVSNISSIDNGIRYACINENTNIVESVGIDISASYGQFLVQSVSAQVGQTFNNGIFE